MNSCYIHYSATKEALRVEESTCGWDMGIRQAEAADRALKFIRDNWIVIGGLVAAGWTIFQFISNRAIPFNVSVGLAANIDRTTKNDDVAASDAEPVLPVTINVNVENKSDWRELAIRNPVWVAYGFRLASPVNDKGERVAHIPSSEVMSRINQAFASDSYLKNAANSVGDRKLFNHSYTKDLIGAGVLLGDPEIKPREKLSVQQILPVAKGTYDFVQIRAYVPTLNQNPLATMYSSKLIVLGQDDGYESQMLFCIRDKDKCRLLTKKDKQPLGGQIHSSVSEIWLGKAAGK
jgi:hypothetical protein